MSCPVTTVVLEDRQMSDNTESSRNRTGTKYIGWETENRVFGTQGNVERKDGDKGKEVKI